MLSIEELKKRNIEHIKETLLSDSVNNMKLIKEEAKELCGRYVDFYNEYGYLIGAVCGNDDYYWVAIKKDLNLIFSSCVSNPTVVDEIENNDFSSLNYLIEHDINGLIDRINSKMNKYNDIFFTPIYINGKEYIIDNMVV